MIRNGLRVMLQRPQATLQLLSLSRLLLQNAVQVTLQMSLSTHKKTAKCAKF